MKKILYILFAITIFTSCSSSDDNIVTPGDKTTSVVVYHNEDIILTNCVLGYLTGTNTYKKIADLGDLDKGQYSKEIVVNDPSINQIYFFTDYLGGTKLNKPLDIVANKKNIFELTGGGTHISDKTDPKQYPR